MNENIEVWKKIFNGNYEVSNFGNVKSNKYINPRLLKPDKSTGYYRVFINKKWFLVHRLVAVNFIENINNKPQVNHINAIKTDNRVENLEWCTASENQIHAFKKGITKKAKGEKHYFSKLKKSDILMIRNSNLKQKELSKIYKVSQSSISNIKKEKSWKF